MGKLQVTFKIFYVFKINVSFCNQKKLVKC